MPGSNKTPRIRLRLSSSHAKEVSPPLLLAASNSLQPTTDDEALKAENEKLKAENAALKMQVDALLHQKQVLVQALNDATTTTTTISNKKRKANDDVEHPAPKKARTPAQRRKLFEKWAKSAMRESAKVKLTTYDCRKTFLAVVKETTPWSKNEFEALFGGDGENNGTKIQPTPEHKPQVTILRFDSYERVQAFFRIGGVDIPRAGYKAKAMKKPLFDASYKAGVWDATLHGLEVHYNKVKCTLQLQFVLVSGNCYHE